MIQINNYTRDNEVYIDNVGDLEIYSETFEGEEISYSIEAIGIEGLEECTTWLDLDSDTKDLLTAIAEQVGKGYYRTIEALQEEAENQCPRIIDDCSSLHQVAYKLEHALGWEEELCLVLNCTIEAYNSLSSYIHTDDIEYTLDQEWGVQFVNNKAYLFLT